MNIRKTTFVTVALAALAAGWPSRAGADQLDKRTYLTFSQPVSIPGKVLPAGTYILQLFDSASDRHIVQIFNRKGTLLIATIRVIPDRRLTATGDTVVVFGERPAGIIKAITHWFYPGDTEGQEFVY